LGKKDDINHHSVFIIVNLLVLIYLLIFKIETTTRLDNLNLPGDLIILGKNVFITNFIELGIMLPQNIWKILTEYYNPNIFIMGAFICFFVYTYLFSALSGSSTKLPGKSFFARLIFFSFPIFYLGYSIFFFNNRVGFSPSGMDNRVAIAASIGIALLVVGVVGWVCSFLPNLIGKWLFSTLLAIFCLTGFVITNTLGQFWVSASSKGNAVIYDVKSAFPAFPRNGTIIVDGICPYFGPAPVFEASWDLKGALEIFYKEKVNADIVTPRLKVTDTAIKTQIYTFETFYPYENLYIYNYKNKKAYLIPDKDSANAYFAQFNPDRNNGCPPAVAGNGVSIF
jgi:hypothetical protein